ncbi:hypothetical protein MCOR17_011341 [Pyricularia oryzae]|nr:hypothetical protein MCOR17_011341 [Pyricularia oryzae]
MRFAAILFAAFLGAQSAKAAGNDNNVKWNGCEIRVLDNSDQPLGSTWLNFGQSGGIRLPDLPYWLDDSEIVPGKYYTVSLEDVHSAHRFWSLKNGADLPPTPKPDVVHPWYWNARPAICRDGERLLVGEWYGANKIRLAGRR